MRLPFLLAYLCKKIVKTAFLSMFYAIIKYLSAKSMYYKPHLRNLSMWCHTNNFR